MQEMNESAITFQVEYILGLLGVYIYRLWMSAYAYDPYRCNIAISNPRYQNSSGPYIFQSSMTKDIPVASMPKKRTSKEESQALIQALI